MITGSFILGATWDLEKTEVPGFKRIGARTENALSPSQMFEDDPPSGI